jgi:hypothetical protein
MPFEHGIYTNKAAALMPASNVSTRGIQVVIGSAPVNLLPDPAAAVKTPILLAGISDVYSKLGYSDDLASYTIMQAVHASLEVFDVAPIVAINVLDPSTHTTEKTSNGAMVGGAYTLSEKSILLDSIVVKNSTDSTTFVLGEDYTAAFNADGTVTIRRIADGDITTDTTVIHNTYDILDPTKVTASDIVAGVAYINRVYQALDYVPEILIAPGYSHTATVGAALIAAAAQISTVFKATAIVDIDSSTATTRALAITAKATNNYSSRNAIVCYPKVKTSLGKIIWMSAQLAALMQFTDSQNDSSPFVSPSNKSFKIIGSYLGDGTTEVLYTLSEANELNAEGIFTALKFQGWRGWGNYTGYYSYTAESSGTVYDPSDIFINVKRAFDWQANGFITRYWSRIDNRFNYRAIQTLITDENQFYNAFIAAGLVAGMKLVYDQKANPASDVMKGILKFKQSLSPYLPIQVLENTLQFDASLLEAALGGES